MSGSDGVRSCNDTRLNARPEPVTGKPLSGALAVLSRYGYAAMLFTKASAEAQVGSSTDFKIAMLLEEWTYVTARQ